MSLFITRSLAECLIGLQRGDQVEFHFQRESAAERRLTASALRLLRAIVRFRRLRTPYGYILTPLSPQRDR